MNFLLVVCCRAFVLRNTPVSVFAVAAQRGRLGSLLVLWQPVGGKSRVIVRELFRIKGIQGWVCSFPHWSCHNGLDTGLKSTELNGLERLEEANEVQALQHGSSVPRVSHDRSCCT